MHIPTALFAISVYILGRSSTVYAESNSDASDAAKDGFKCYDRIYAKDIIYTTTQYYCETIKIQPLLRNRTVSEAGYRIRFPLGTDGDVHNLLTPYHDAVPILENGKLFPFELEPNSRLTKNSHGETVMIYPGQDRLIINSDCIVLGAFIDLSNGTDTGPPKVEECTVLDISSDMYYLTKRLSSRSFRSPSRSPERSPQRPREPSSERSRKRSRESSSKYSPQHSRESSPEYSPQRSRETFQGKSPQRPREPSSERSRKRSRESSPEYSPQHSRESSPEYSPQHSRESSPEYSPQHSRESSPEYSPQRSRETYQGRSPQRPREKSPELSSRRSPESPEESYSPMLMFPPYS